MLICITIYELLILGIGVMVFHSILWTLSLGGAVALYIAAIKMIGAGYEKTCPAKVLYIIFVTAVFALFVALSQCQGWFIVPLLIFDSGIFFSFIAGSRRSKVLCVALAAVLGALILII